MAKNNIEFSEILRCYIRVINKTKILYCVYSPFMCGPRRTVVAGNVLPLTAATIDVHMRRGCSSISLALRFPLYLLIAFQ